MKTEHVWVVEYHYTYASPRPSLSLELPDERTLNRCLDYFAKHDDTKVEKVWSKTTEYSDVTDYWTQQREERKAFVAKVRADNGLPPLEEE